MYDVIIIGGGPAGMTAAIYVARQKLHTLMLTRDIGGQINLTLGIPGYTYQVLDGLSLVEKFHQQTSDFPIRLKEGESVLSLAQAGNARFEVSTRSGDTYEAQAIIVSTGRSPSRLGIQGEDAFVGKGLTYCSTCDGPLFAGKRVVVVGDGDSAVATAHEMVSIADQVYLVTRQLQSGLRLTQRLRTAGNLTIVPLSEVRALMGNEFVEAVQIQDLNTQEQRKLEVEGIFVEKGLSPSSGLVRDMLTLNDRGEIPIDQKNGTGVPGLYAAGDVTDIFAKQLIVAAGEGAKAALQTYRYLQQMEMDRPHQ